MSLRKGPRRSGANFGSIRDRKISAPIPINDDEESQIGNAGPGTAPSLSNEYDQDQAQLRDSAFTAPRLPPYRDAGSSQYSAEPVPQTQRSAVSNPDPQTEAETQQSSTAPVYRRNSVIHRRSVLRGKPQRKKSTFKSMMGKIFGKKEKDTTSPIGSSDGPDNLRAEQHRSVSILPCNTNEGIFLLNHLN